MKIIHTCHSKNVRGANTLKSCQEVGSLDTVLLVVLVVVDGEKDEVVAQSDDVVDVLRGKGDVIFLPTEFQSEWVDVGYHHTHRLALLHLDNLRSRLGKGAKR